MGLVDYAASSSSDSDTAPKASLKRKRSHEALASQNSSTALPALPSSFRDLYATKVRASTHDDPALHGGRKRAMPHVEGNWPTHVYLEWYPAESEVELLQTFIDDVQRNIPLRGRARPKLHSSIRSELGTPLPLHISLSCPLLLRTEQRDEFETALRSAIKAVALREGTIAVALSDVRWVANAEKTRWFLALKTARPEGDDLNRLLRACNGVCGRFGFQQLYNGDHYGKKRRTSPPEKHGKRDSSGSAAVRAASDAEDRTDCFHFSIAWTVELPYAEERAGHVVDAPDSIDRTLSSCVIFNEMKLKIGNAIASLPLSRSRIEEANRSILG